MREIYYLVSKEDALKAGLTSKIRHEIKDQLVVSEKDLKNIGLEISQVNKYVKPKKQK